MTLVPLVETITTNDTSIFNPSDYNADGFSSVSITTNVSSSSQTVIAKLKSISETVRLSEFEYNNTGSQIVVTVPANCTFIWIRESTGLEGDYYIITVMSTSGTQRTMYVQSGEHYYISGDTNYNFYFLTADNNYVISFKDDIEGDYVYDNTSLYKTYFTLDFSS